VLDLVSKDTSSPEAVASVLDKWAATGKVDMPAGSAGAGGVQRVSKQGGGMATVHVFVRQMRLALTDPLLYIGRLVMFPFIISFFGLVYVASHENVQKQIPFRLFYLWWVLALPPCLGITAVIGTSRDTRSVVSEIQAGMYGVFSYVVSTSFVQIPMLLLLTVVTSVCAFAIGGWPWESFVSYVFQYAINMWVFESAGQLLAVLFESPVFGMLGYLIMWSNSIIFCGLVFRGEDVVWPFRAFYYILPMRWLFNGLGYDVYGPDTFKGASDCVANSTVVTDQGETTCTEAGFYCEDARNSFGCWGHTGDQVLKTLHMTYESLDSKDDRALDVGIMLGMVVVIKMAYVAMLWRKSTISDTPRSS